MTGIIGGLSVLWSIIVIIICIIWIILPFIVIKIKNEVQESNTLLKQVIRQNQLIQPEILNIEYEKSLEACLVCSHLKNNRCEKTGWNINAWKRQHYEKQKKNPCAGEYFEKRMMNE